MIKKVTIFLLSILFLGLNACKEDKPKNILPPQKMQAILQDLHLYDALLSDKRYFDSKFKDSSISYYNYIWEKNQTDYKEFKKSLEYYSARTEVLSAIYDSIFSHFTKMRDSIRNGNKLELNISGYTMNLWSQKTEWHVPSDGAKNSIRFNIATNSQGLYTLSADILMYPNDSSVNPKMTIVAYYEDGTLDASSDYNIKKDKTWLHHTAKVKTNPNKKLKRIAGWVLDHSRLNGTKHADVVNLKLLYTTK